MALSTLSNAGNSLTSYAQSFVESTAEFRSKFGPYHWLALGAGLLGVVAWKMLSRPNGIPPGPRSLPLIGNLHQLSEATHKDFMKFGEIYGEVFSLYFGGQLVVVLNSRRAIKEAFVNMGTMFADRPPSVFVSPEDKSLFSESYGEVFNAKKKFAVMALRYAGFGSKEAESQMLWAVDDVIDFLQKQNSQPVDLLMPIQKGCANVIMSILFRKHFPYDDPQLEEVVNKVENFMGTFSSWVVMADFVPKWMVPLFFRRALNHVQQQADVFMNRFSLPYIKEHKENFDPSNIKDFVDYYLKGDDMTEEQLAKHCMWFFPDAMSTTGKQIMWNIFYLAQYQDVQTKIQKELEQVLGSQRPSVASRANLHYTEAFLWESLRYTTIAPTTLLHKPLEDTTLFGYHIPKTASVIANIWSVHMDPNCWPEPRKFRPERHLDSDGKFVKRDNVITFGQGRRMCMGEQLVKTETFMFVASLVQRFTFRFAENEAPPELEDRSESVYNEPPTCQLCAIPR